MYPGFPGNSYQTPKLFRNVSEGLDKNSSNRISEKTKAFGSSDVRKTVLFSALFCITPVCLKGLLRECL